MLGVVTTPEFFDAQALVQRLVGTDRPVVFLVGSALTIPTEGVNENETASGCI